MYRLHHHRFVQVLPKAFMSLGTIAAVFCTGSVLFPAHAQSLSSSGVNAVAANAPLPKAQLFVNPSLGKDDVSVGQDESTPFKTITFALQQAKPGMMIQMAPGTYTKETGEVFPLVVPPGVILQGNEFNQGGTTIIMGGGFHSSSWWGSQNVALWAKANSQIVGVLVTNLNSRGTGIWIESADVTVRGCTLTKNAREGVFVAGQGSATLENNLFVENNANGVALTGMSKGMVRNNTFQRTGFGIAVSEKAAPEIVNNRIQDNVDGIVVSHSATPQLRGNTIEGSKRDGLVAIADAKPDLGSTTAPGRNIFRNNGRFALYNATAKNTLAVEGNDVTGNIQMVALTSTGSADSAAAPTSPAASAAQVESPAALPILSSGAMPNAPTAKPKTLANAPKSPDLTKAKTVKYKGKTYILLEDVLQSAQ